LGPFVEAAVVKDDCEPRLELDADDIEPTRGDEVLDEYAWVTWVRARDGSLSLYNERGASW
jgi:hypothetical protein